MSATLLEYKSIYMNKLFLDIGNSLVKWATVSNEDYVLHGTKTIKELLENNLSDLEQPCVPDEVYFSSVASAASVDSLKSCIQQKWNLFPTQLTAQKSCCGLICGYDQFEQLGDDRWFAMMGAIGVYDDAPLLVIDAGTALTIDAVMNGKHLGGFIVPGLQTMRHALAKSTADLSVYDDSCVVEANKQSDSLLATNTADAILGGTLYMSASFINQIIVDLNIQLNTVFKVILTGGEASQLFKLLDVDFDYIPDLVLQGMVNVEESVKKV